MNIKDITIDENELDSSNGPLKLCCECKEEFHDNDPDWEDVRCTGCEDSLCVCCAQNAQHGSGIDETFYCGKCAEDFSKCSVCAGLIDDQDKPKKCIHCHQLLCDSCTDSWGEEHNAICIQYYDDSDNDDGVTYYYCEKCIKKIQEDENIDFSVKFNWIDQELFVRGDTYYKRKWFGENGFQWDKNLKVWKIPCDMEKYQSLLKKFKEKFGNAIVNRQLFLDRLGQDIEASRVPPTE